MKFFLKSLILSTLIILLFSSAYAESTFWRGAPPNRKVRQAQACVWLSCLKKIENQIPTLSPAEKRWIETEYDKELERDEYRKLTRRALSAMDSREYHIRLARSQIEEIINNLTFLANNKAVERNREMIMWALLTHKFINGDFWRSISVIVDRKIIDKEICDLETLYFENFVLQAQAIIQRVIINHLNGTLP